MSGGHFLHERRSSYAASRLSLRYWLRRRGTVESVPPPYVRLGLLAAKGRGNIFRSFSKEKQTFGSPITVFSSHNLSQLLTYKGLQTLPPSRVLSLQVALIEDPTLTFQSCLPLNISNLLPQPNTDQSLSHSCTETLEELLPHPSHIQEGTLPQAIYTWYTDGSSFLHEGARRAGYAIVSDTEVVEAQALPAHTTNQQA